jgi:hypothetical protein
MIHRGEIVEKIVRRSSYSLAKLSLHLGISRNTLYNRFLCSNLNWQFISKVGNFIHYDFALEFPELKEEPGLITQNAVFRAEDKYIRLLEKYNQLLGIVIRIASKHGIHKIQQEIVQLVDTPKEKEEET